jgi:hypothetical protein
MPENWERNVWCISNPPVWPKPPQWMSFTMLSELESCSRRCALTIAEYPSVWEKQGYPHIPRISSIEGTVIHLALKKISHALAKRRSHSLKDAYAVSALKDLGGYTVIITDCIESVLRQYEGNPRATPVMECIKQFLLPRVPKLRAHIQRLLSRIHLAADDSITSDEVGKRIRPFSHQLPYGSHTEVELKVPDMGWHGVADLLTHTPADCEIRDFKSGVYKPQHKLQLLIYALLWALDRNLNPHGRLADKLVLSYDEHDVEIPAPNRDGLSSLEAEIRKRTETVIIELQHVPPEARPSQENCEYCIVRQLCEEYWHWLRHTGKCYDKSPAGLFTDLQIELTARHGPTSWDGMVESSRLIDVGQSILLRTINVPFDLHAGQRIRLLHIYINVSQAENYETEQHATIATMGTNTEVFLLQE